MGSSSGGSGGSDVFGGDLALSMRDHSGAVMRYSAALAKRMGLEVSEVAALGHIQQVGPMKLGAVRGMLSMSAGAVTTLVDRLEAKGYVERIRNPDDRRSYLVRCTEYGFEESLSNLMPYIEDIQSVEGKFSADEKEIIGRFLDHATATTHEHALRLTEN